MNFACERCVCQASLWQKQGLVFTCTNLSCIHSLFGWYVAGKKETQDGFVTQIVIQLICVM